MYSKQSTLRGVFFMQKKGRRQRPAINSGGREVVLKNSHILF